MSGRDIVYAAETVQLIDALDQQKSLDADAPPWLVVSSFVNPHDIVLYGALAARLPDFRFDVEPMPAVPPPPTRHESLSTKPNCQAGYRDLYPSPFSPSSMSRFIGSSIISSKRTLTAKCTKLLTL